MSDTKVTKFQFSSKVYDVRIPDCYKVTFTILSQLPHGSICGIGMYHTVDLENKMSISHHGLDEVDPVPQVPLPDAICAPSIPELRLSYFSHILQDYCHPAPGSAMRLRMFHLTMISSQVYTGLYHLKPHSELNCDSITIIINTFKLSKRASRV